MPCLVAATLWISLHRTCGSKALLRCALLGFLPCSFFTAVRPCSSCARINLPVQTLPPEARVSFSQAMKIFFSDVTHFVILKQVGHAHKVCYPSVAHLLNMHLPALPHSALSGCNSTLSSNCPIKAGACWSDKS